MSSTQSMTFDIWFNTNYGQIAGVLPLEPKLRLLVKAQMRIAWTAALVLNGQVIGRDNGRA